jgi:hypothetical protein
MNFADITKKLQQQAEKAATAAKNFKGFDEMAENDEYIHNDSLNVKKQPHGQSQSKPLHQIITGNLWILPSVAVDRSSSHVHPPGPQLPQPASFLDQNVRGSLPSVAKDISKQSSKKLQPQYYDEEQPSVDNESSDQDSDEDDPI